MSRILLRRIDQFRRKYSKTIGRWFYKAIGQDRFLSNERLAHDQIKHILVLRNNKRIGNMYFLLPFMHRLRQLFPAANIELMVIDASQIQVFAHLPIDQIHVSNFSFGKLGPLFKMVRSQRQVVYDLLLMPHGSSTDMVLGALLHARNKVSDYNEQNSHVYRHALEVQRASEHAARTPLDLLRALAPQVPDSPIDHHMALTQAERQTAQQQVAAIRIEHKYCIAYFRGARGNKIIDDTQWRKIREGFDRCSDDPICWIEILSPDITAALGADTRTWQSADLRKLAAFLAACDLFICGDTGPLHLADAAAARCVGLFTATSPLHYGCLGAYSTNITNLDAIDYPHLLKNALETRPMAAAAS